jgi:hypothetical protein
MDYVKAVTSIPASSLPTPSLLASVGQTGYFGPATVCEINAGERLVLVQWEQAGQSRRVWARPTFSIAKPLIPGDVALALSQNPTDVYLIGLISDAPRGDAPETGSLQTSGGASVRVVKSAGEEVVEVRSKQGSLVIEYRPESGKAVVNVEHGDLEFTTQNGSIAFNSAQKISLTSARLETHADTVVAQAKNVYLSVEELSQLQAGRTRTLVKGSCHLQARDAFLNAEEDFKIDGKQIHLG